MSEDESTALDEFLADASPEEHEEWKELADAYYGGVSVTLGAIGDRVFVIWNAMEGTSSGWDEWAGSDEVIRRRKAADRAAEEMAAEYAGFYGVPTPDDTYGLDNINETLLLPRNSVEIGTLLFHFPDLEVVNEMKLFNVQDGQIAVTISDAEHKVIGYYESIERVRESVRKPGFMCISFWPADGGYTKEWIRWA